MHHSILIAPLLLTLPICASVNDISPFLQGPSHTGDWDPTKGSGGSFGRALPGDFDGDGFADVVVQHGLQAVLLYAPDRYGAGSKLKVGCTSLAVAFDPVLGRDVVLTVDRMGLSSTTLNSADMSVSSTVIATGDWETAKWLRARNEASSDDALVAALRQDGQSIVLLELDASSDWAATSLANLSINAPALDGELLDWDGDGQLELAVLTTAGLAIMERNGTLLGSWPQNSTGGHLTAFSENWLSGERLAWHLEGGGGATEWLTVLDSGGLHETLDLTGLGIVGMAAGDLDNDGDDEVALSITSARELLVLRNQRSPAATTGASFSMPNILTVALGQSNSPAPNNVAKPILADLDGDGDIDFFQTVEDEEKYFVQRNQQVLEGEMRATPIDLEYRLTDNPLTGTLKVTVNHPVTPRAGMTHYQVTTWGMLDAWSTPLPTAILNQLIPVQTVGNDQTLEIVLPETVIYFPRVYAIEISQVRVGAHGEVLERSPVGAYYFAMEDIAEERIEIYEDWGPRLDVMPRSYVEGTADPKNPGGFVPRSKIAPFKDSELPIRGE